MYRDAAAVLEQLIRSESPENDDNMRRRVALLVTALSYFDPRSAEQRSTLLLPSVQDDSVDAEMYERTSARLSRNRVAKLVARMADAEAKKQERKKQSKKPEKRARKRAARREKYLNRLRSKRDYNPSIGLVKPDPERWIPRKQRSYAKRGRRGRHKFVGAQGSGMGGSKDTMKLDAAARASLQEQQLNPDKGVVAESKPSAVQRKARKKKRR